MLLSANNQLVALDPKDGAVLHHYPVTGKADNFSWNATGVAVIANTDMKLDNYKRTGSVSFFLHDGNKPVWRKDLAAGALGSIVCDDGQCYLGARDGVFRALNINDGALIWQIDCSQLLDKTDGVVWADSYVLDLGRSIVFSPHHRDIRHTSLIVCAAKDTGRILWSVKHPQLICGSFVRVDDRIIAVGEDRKVLSIEIHNGKPTIHDLLPPADRGEFAGIVKDGDQLYIPGADAHIWKVSISAVLGAEKDGGGRTTNGGR